MRPAPRHTLSDLAVDEAIRLRPACRPRTFTRERLVRLVGADARLHILGLRREPWCRTFGEIPMTGRIVPAPIGEACGGGPGSADVPTVSGTPRPGTRDRQPRRHAPVPTAAMFRHHDEVVSAEGMA